MKRWLIILLVLLLGYLPTNSSQKTSQTYLLSRKQYQIEKVEDLKITVDGFNYLSTVHGIETDNIPNGCPIDMSGFSRISDPFGYRIHPIYHRLIFHCGVDFAGKKGTNVYATGNGRVIFAGRKHGYGKIVIINHGDGIVTKYAHLKSYNVKVGDIVTQSTVIGKLGNSGASTGPHLHYEVRINNNPINPFLLYSKNLSYSNIIHLLNLKNNERCSYYHN